MKKYNVLLILSVLFVLCAFSLSANAVTLTYSHVVMPETSLNKAALKFEAIVEKETNGEVQVEVYPSAALGGNREVLEGLQMGTIAMTSPAMAPLAQFTDATVLFDLPYLFSNAEVAQKVLQGEIGQSILKDLESAGFKGLVYFTQGYRHVTNSVRAIKAPEDFKNLKIRNMQNPVHMAHFKAMGASPIPMAFSEVFTALQQKTIDGQENPYENNKLMAFTEVQKYISETGHLYDPVPLLISMPIWESLSAEHQAIIQKAAIEARDYQLNILHVLENNIKTDLEKAGKNVIVLAKDIDKKACLKASLPVYEEYGEKAGWDRIVEILNMQGEYGQEMIKLLGK